MGLPRREDFLIKEIPALHPLSQDYISYWREQKRRCILGYWVGGTWMPPALYYYVNFHTIRLNETLDSNSKTFARPYLRDLEWNFFLHYTEARGFSGFQDDDLYSCHRVLLDESVSLATLKRRFPNTISSSGEKKIYVPARSYMTQVFPCPMGKPLFENSLQNIMMLGSRDSGKSYSVAGLIAHNFLFDGATDYDEQLIVKPAPTELIVGAEKSDKSTDLLKKVRDAFDFLPGKQTLNDKTYPAPFAKRYKGSWEPNKEIIAEYKKKIKGTWTATGSKSSIKHRTFNTDAYAAQGTRPLMLVLEECFSPNTKFLDSNFNIIEAKNIQVGTTLIGSDGNPATVKKQWTGESTMYRISPKYAEPFEITGKHLLYLEPNNYLKKTFPDPIKVSVEEYLTWAAYKRNNYQIPISTTVDFEEKELPIDPYLLGLWLGDGESRSGNIYNSDKELIDYLTPIASKITQVRDTTTYTFKVEGLADVLSMYGLKNNKHIPEVYLKNSRNNRLNILAGLIDSDGHYVKNRVTPSFEISSYTTLGYDIINLCRSLGFRVTYKLYKKYMRILIRGKNLSEIPTKVVRKQAENRYYSNLNLSPFKVEKLDEGEYVGFTVDNSTSNVLLADYTVVSNCGMFTSLKEVYTNTVDNLRRGMRKTGMLMMLGTGGDMESGTLAAAEMFYEPNKYDILSMPDIYENRGQIGYFIPAYITLDEFKDDNGETDIEASKADLIRVRKTMETGSSYALSKEMQYRPIVPSEMFLTKTANIFPTVELRRRLSEVQVHSIYDNLEKKVDLFFDPSSPYNGVSYEINTRLEAITTFPYEGDAREGAVVIYEFPQTIDDRVPSDAYIIGCDPFRDDSQTGQSLASIYVMKTSKYLSSFGYDEIVAEYVGRPYLGKNAVNETLHKLSLFYGGAKIYFENAVGNVKDYFEKVRKLELLAKQPVTVFNRKAAIDSGPQVIYGYPMSNQKIKWEALQYLRMWLLEERSDGKRNLDLINSPSLLQELINFNMDGNFDRVMGLVGCIVGLEELRNLERRRMYSREETSQIRKDFERLIVNNPRLFNAKFSKTTAILHGEI